MLSRLGEFKALSDRDTLDTEAKATYAMYNKHFDRISQKNLDRFMPSQQPVSTENTTEKKKKKKKKEMKSKKK